MAKSMLGFDIGTSELKIAQWDGHEVTQTLHATMPDNMVKNGVIVSYEAMADFIKETVRGNRLKGSSCAVILPSSFTFLRRITMPAMTVDQLAINLPYEFRDFLDMGKDKYFYDYSVVEIIKDESGKPVQMELVAAAIAKSIIEDYRDMFRRAGLKLVTAVPAECAYANLIERKGGEEKQEYAILNIGHTVTRIDIYTGSRFEVSHIGEIGLDEVDQMISDGLNVDTHVARTYKQSNHQDVLNAEGCREVYRGIATDVRKAVNFYGFNNRESNLHDVWCCGGGAFIPALVETVGEATDLTVHPIEELLPPLGSGVTDAALFVAAIGAAIQ